MARKLGEKVFQNFCTPSPPALPPPPLMGAQQICLQMDKRRVFQIWTKQFFRMFDSPSIVGVPNIWLKMEKRKWRESWTKGFRLIGKENHRKITSKQCSNLKSLEAEITKRQPYKKTERMPYWKMALACLANLNWAWPSSAPACFSYLWRNVE